MTGVAGSSMQDPRFHFAADRTDRIVGETCAVLDRCGVGISPTKVHRLVHRYVERVQQTGYGFAEWIANGVALHAEQRARIAWGLRNAFGVPDPTGQQAARNVDRERTR